jgi:hypothetical protein
VLQKGEHYGEIPGCGKKPTLLQAGAEKIAYMFHLVPSYTVTRYEMGGGHREYEVECVLASRDTGERVGEGLGTCSTMESKYRYRSEWNPETRRKDKKRENPDIADTWNTVLKMAKKRAFVDAVKSTTAASDIFTQDIEDMVAYEVPQTAPQQPQQAPQAQAQPTQPDPRKALWNEAAELKQKVLGMGANEEGIKSWMASAIKNPDGTPKPTGYYTVEDIESLKTHLQKQIEDLESLKRNQNTEPEIIVEEYVEPDYSDEDIPF